MANMNLFFQNLKDNYLFATIKQRVTAFSEANPDKDLISLGIGDVTRPLAPAVVEAMHRAVDEMGTAEGFHGYGPDPGYAFLREAIAAGDYAARGVQIGTDEIFISDGAKSDVGNIGDIFAADNTVLITDPVYPVYFDSNVMAGRTVKFVPLDEAGGFCPVPPDFHADMIYLCSPNNPTGAAMGRDSLQAWVDYALKHDAVILFDSAYEAFITEPGIPHSIYEIEGAKQCAIEFRSFSKTAGFTGTRCAYAVVPKQLSRNGVSLNGYWGPQTGYEIQRRVLYCTARRAGRLHRGGPGADQRDDRLLHGQCKDYPRGARGRRLYGLRRRERAVYLAEVPRWAQIVGSVRSAHQPRLCRRHAGPGLRRTWRRFLPPDCLRHARKHRKSS